MAWQSNLVFFLGIATGMVIQTVRQQRRSSIARPAEPDQPVDNAPASPTALSEATAAPSQGEDSPNWPQLAAIAQEIGQFKAGFLGRAAHELRSPINGVLGLHQLILNGLCDSPEEEREFVEQAYHSTLKTLNLMDELIAISKLESTPPSAEPTAVSLQDLFHQVKDAVHLLAENRNLHLEFYPPDPDVAVWGIAGLIRQLLINLVSQAIRDQDGGQLLVYSQALSAEGTSPAWVEIYLNDQRPDVAWQEPLAHLAESEQAALSSLTAARQWLQTWSDQPRFYPSSSLTWLLNCSLVETLNGTLELHSAADCPRSPGAQDLPPESASRVVCCRLPLAIGTETTAS